MYLEFGVVAREERVGVAQAIVVVVAAAARPAVARSRPARFVAARLGHRRAERRCQAASGSAVAVVRAVVVIVVVVVVVVVAIVVERDGVLGELPRPLRERVAARAAAVTAPPPRVVVVARDPRVRERDQPSAAADADDDATSVDFRRRV